MEQINEPKKVSIILHTRFLTLDEETHLAKLFDKVMPFLHSYHGAKTLQQFSENSNAQLITINIGKPATLKWWKEQNHDNFNIIILTPQLKKKHTKLALMAIGWITGLDTTITCVDELVQRCNPLSDFCRSLCCF